MSSFHCEHCGTAIIDTPRGYVTECEHYPLEKIDPGAEAKREAAIHAALRGPGACRSWGTEAALHKIVADMERLAEAEGEDLDAMARAAGKNVGDHRPMTAEEREEWVRDELRDFP